MTEEERDVLMKAISLVRWKRAEMLGRDPYGTSCEKTLVAAVDHMMAKADSQYGGWDWCVDEVVQAFPLGAVLPEGTRRYAVRGPGSWDQLFFKRIARCASEADAKVVAACLDGLEVDSEGNPWP